MKPNSVSSTLVQYSDNFQQALSNFELPDDQLEFTSYPLKKIQDPFISPDTVHVMIVAEEKPVG
ncbi:hypothetical protein [Bacillus sp. KH172YL63]|uniref:hypothetical protein n=1 Tax=Bacillus sp. KH172YL63 TaxID=2709784 RepID=UPI0013E4F509|nr:hypothetical protein [Bacillus sp. KH172YL63]BCB04197.1 hypothetical protein KH172YL63_23300 [Bacillus sp. KH172YL63]